MNNAQRKACHLSLNQVMESQSLGKGWSRKTAGFRRNWQKCIDAVISTQDGLVIYELHQKNDY
jgi:hypothetical protein